MHSEISIGEMTFLQKSKLNYFFIEKIYWNFFQLFSNEEYVIFIYILVYNEQQCKNKGSISPPYLI